MRQIVLSLVLSALLAAGCTQSSEDAEAVPADLHDSEVPVPLPPVDADLLRDAKEACGLDVFGTVDFDFERYCLGPVLASGDMFDSAEPTISFQGDWHVNPVFTEDGIAEFNEVAAACFQRQKICPTARLAMVLNGIVLSAPEVQTSYFERDRIVISGNFSQERARQIASVLNEPFAAANTFELRAVLEP